MNKQTPAPGAVMLDLEGPHVTVAERAILQRSAVGGLILFSRNYESPGQLRELISEVRTLRPEILIAVDQEGGRVQRFREGFLALPPLHAIGKCYRQGAAQARQLAHSCGWAMAAEVMHYGIDFSFAPVLDLYTTDCEAIGDRAFAGDPDTVVELAGSYIAGMREAGMAATGKHYPGHGTVAADSHLELPRDERSAEQILESDYRVFAACIQWLTAIMPAHVVYPAVDQQGAGYSKVWLQQKLRGELDFDGVIFSDDLSMAAAASAGGVAQRAAKALAAGCDMVLVCNDREAALRVCDWVDKENIPGSRRLQRMRAQPAVEVENLYRQEKWTQAVAAVQSLQ